MAEQKPNEESSGSKKGSKRPIEIISIADAEKRDLDFTNPNSSKQLQVSDVELVFSDGVLYANAAILLKTSDFFQGMILDTWHSTDHNDMHRCVYPMSDPAIGGLKYYQSMIPVLHLAYSNRATVVGCIEELFAMLPVLDEFLTFADKIGSPALIENIHRAIGSRSDNHLDIYPILKKHSNYGRLLGLTISRVDNPVSTCLELSFFVNFFSPAVMSPPKESKRRPFISMFEQFTNFDDVQFFWDNFCSAGGADHTRQHALRHLLLFNKDALVATIDNLDLSRWTIHEICCAAKWCRIYNFPPLMEKLLKYISSVQPAKK